GLALAVSEPQCDRTAESESVHSVPEWPSVLFSRNRQVVSEHFVLYANDSGAADRLRVWVEAELSVLRSRYGACPIPQGLVVAIERGEEPDSAIEAWWRRNVGVPDMILWAGPYEKRGRHTGAGRPYCLSAEPYFRESFLIPPGHAGRLWGLSEAGSRPAWVCFLTTDGHLTAAFEGQARKRKEAHRRELRDVPAVVRIMSGAGEALMRMGAGVFWKRYETIDSELMHLQRREILWRAVMGQVFTDESRLSEHIASLQSETDGTWKDLWLRRQID
ncbi:MAG: hypothetical protein ACE5EX_11275, partial [Phycisphaerae bacterium]